MYSPAGRPAGGADTPTVRSTCGAPRAMGLRGGGGADRRVVPRTATLTGARCRARRRGRSRATGARNRSRVSAPALSAGGAALPPAGTTGRNLGRQAREPGALGGGGVAHDGQAGGGGGVGRGLQNGTARHGAARRPEREVSAGMQGWGGARARTPASSVRAGTGEASRTRHYVRPRNLSLRLHSPIPSLLTRNDLPSAEGVDGCICPVRVYPALFGYYSVTDRGLTVLRSCSMMCLQLLSAAFSCFQLLSAASNC
jgi:hypothetical protein